jgi:predicted nuclease with TOPRIM domain
VGFMENQISNALIDFYQKILKPDFDRIDAKLAEHDQRFTEMTEHLDSIYHRLGRVEDELLMVSSRVDRVDGKLDRVKGCLDRMEGRLDQMEGRLNQIRVGSTPWKSHFNPPLQPALSSRPKLPR